MLHHVSVKGHLGHSTFEQLLAEADEASIDGWDFSWLGTGGRLRSGLAGAIAEAPSRGSAGPSRSSIFRPVVERFWPRC